MFGRGRGRERASRGADLQAQVSLSFEDSLRGIETQIPVEAELACRECGGSGAQPGTSPTICPECKGRGVTVEEAGSWALDIRVRAAAAADGDREALPRCHGIGRVRRTKSYKVKIPAGVKNGTRSASRARASPATAAARPAT